MPQKPLLQHWTSRLKAQEKPKVSTAPRAGVRRRCQARMRICAAPRRTTYQDLLIRGTRRGGRTQNELPSCTARSARCNHEARLTYSPGAHPKSTVAEVRNLQTNSLRLALFDIRPTPGDDKELGLHEIGMLVFSNRHSTSLCKNVRVG